MEWEAIEYRLTGSDPLICVQWDGIIGRWRVLDEMGSGATFATLEQAKAFAESIATPEPR